MSDDGIAWYAGLDWGGETHCVCLLTAQGGKLCIAGLRPALRTLASALAW